MHKNAIALNEIRQLANKMKTAGLQALEWRGTSWAVRIGYTPRSTFIPLSPGEHTAADVELNQLPVIATLPGRIVLRHPDDNEAYVQVGQHVQQNELLALIKVGPLYLPLRSPVNGTLTSIKVEPEQCVEYGCEIMWLEPDEVAGSTL